MLEDDEILQGRPLPWDILLGGSSHLVSVNNHGDPKSPIPGVCAVSLPNGGTFMAYKWGVTNYP